MIFVAVAGLLRHQDSDENSLRSDDLDFVGGDEDIDMIGAMSLLVGGAESQPRTTRSLGKRNRNLAFFQLYDGCR